MVGGVCLVDAVRATEGFSMKRIWAGAAVPLVPACLAMARNAGRGEGLIVVAGQRGPVTPDEGVAGLRHRRITVRATRLGGGR
ncbi:hypothetical protein [Sphingomonas rubra]|uniref:Uncharacterized protein n=1 Tax=Sphingomonas rubra TaxID=634430 RepID=A0A1I5PKJ9_9SPHN|nr:hypothetical protein [Sphingomonas rubra]SFP34051.1 hypothetical protein SAMN04488241_10145 [Sphingomonas rubra]